MTTVGIVQARAGSSRLPGKVLEPINGVPMLEKVLARLGRSEELSRLVVATTREPEDDAVATLAERCGARVVRGDRFDVLDRFHDVLLAEPATDVVVRVTADCPFIDAEVVDHLVRLRRDRNADFVANRLPPPERRTYPVGLDVEVCTASALRSAWRNAASPFEREHVMPHLYVEPGRFRVVIDQLEEDLSAFRWTVDVPEDLEAVRAIDAACGPEPFGWRHVLDVVRANPRLHEINAGFVQKDIGEVDERWSPGSAPPAT
jgi:spore coat polysaccharide biosynthesis protein SpsF